MNDIVPFTINQIKDLYLHDDRPWVVGFSGGKDSTTILQLIFYTLLELPKEMRKKHVTVICSNTLVELPPVLDIVEQVLEEVKIGIRESNLPISLIRVTPEIDNTFWVNLIGRGYPAPNKWFRWCTERLKIDPVSKYIQKQIDIKGSVIVVLGIRSSESSTRAQVIANHKRVREPYLSKHNSLANAYIFSPIVDWTASDVWTYLESTPPPWGGDHDRLVQLYKNASGECPLILDKSTPSCGGSRFGCWVCTVVKYDKSAFNLIDSGSIELKPLFEFRNWLAKERNNPDARKDRRRNGQLGMGPFLFEMKIEILKRLFETSKASGLTLIQNAELEIIQSLWTQEEGAEANLTSKIYNKVFIGGANIYSEKEAKREEEALLLKETCENNNINYAAVEQLVEVEKTLLKLKRKVGLTNKIDTVIERAINGCED